MQEKIKKAILVALATDSYRLKITFKRESPDNLLSLVRMNRQGIISLNRGDELIALSLIETNSWGKHNRTFVLSIGYKFDEKIFIEKMENAIEQIKAVGSDF